MCNRNMVKRVLDKMSYDLDPKVKLKGKKTGIIDLRESFFSFPKLHIGRVMRKSDFCK